MIRVLVGNFCLGSPSDNNFQTFRTLTFFVPRRFVPHKSLNPALIFTLTLALIRNSKTNT